MTLTSSQIRVLVAAIGGLEKWRRRCHECAIAIVRTGLVDRARVARGWHTRVTSQHSWVVVGDPYRPELIVDGVLWSYTGEKPSLYTAAKCADFMPKGHGSIWDAGRPPDPVGEVVALKRPLSPVAQSFMKVAAPKGLDVVGWSTLANGPMSGWPSAEIIDAMYCDERLRPHIPIDVVGMLTDRNPGELYF